MAAWVFPNPLERPQLVQDRAGHPRLPPKLFFSRRWTPTGTCCSARHRSCPTCGAASSFQSARRL
jgi:hypothetical protein